MSNHNATCLALGLGLLISTPSLAQPQYSVQTLGPGLLINDMNLSGEIVGWTVVGGNVQAFVVGPSHPYQTLPLPPGYGAAWAQGINDLGVVVGSASVGSFPEFGQAVSWTPNGAGGYSTQLLGTLPNHTMSVAYDVNNRGDIVGSSLIPGFGGGPTGSTPPPACWTSARSARRPASRRSMTTVCWWASTEGCSTSTR